MHDLAVYDFLDRPVADLPAREHRLLAAMRGWVHALTLGADPSGAALAAFDAVPLAAAPFDRLMRALDAGSAEPMTFQRPCHDTVEDVEAVLLALWARAADRAAVTAALALLVDAQAAATMADGMAEVASLMEHAPAPRR